MIPNVVHCIHVLNASSVFSSTAYSVGSAYSYMSFGHHSSIKLLIPLSHLLSLSDAISHLASYLTRRLFNGGTNASYILWMIHDFSYLGLILYV